MFYSCNLKVMTITSIFVGFRGMLDLLALQEQWAPQDLL